ncbi:MAG: methyltransferase type 11 [Candidatus Yanofskybacteria bacterium CG10_big_fil_rev_8_21_14_0_10_37_15]|uniref:Methyltransferase type 11 n=1 Tax=Candidatus Yanofskybacteria bacterium CG10_big_fil_rev_8_21_14_0_10_37_15 TaxID=1975097 RepID=A0A2H0R5X8_9BACT|nr:MAG: methyltransferase type 11 [Candidatus Yanofskybacteria bacterium CG10_big_fil_rev_8_21_14_0_10_37_15]
MTRENYYQDKSIHYGVAHTRLKRILDLVGNLSNKRVLDVGCARGYIGSKVKSMGNFVVGVDISQSAVEKAKEVLDEVYVYDLEKDCPKFGEKFDLAILPEVLEHVFDPVEVLKKINSNLNDDGEIIITTPNIMLWTSRVKLLLGKFEYTDQGLMDFGHIRFFTYKYLNKVLRDSGFEIVKEHSIIFPGKLTRILKRWPSLFATQFIIKAKKIV